MSKQNNWIFVIIGFILVLVVNGMANSLPLGGQTTGEISDKYPSLFTPAGFTFSIWGVIYTFLLGFVIYQSMPNQRNDTIIEKIRLPFIVNCLANASWIIAWHYDLLVVSIFIMSIILISLIAIYRQLNLWEGKHNWARLLFLQMPFSIYIGWITVAIIANISAVQIGFGLEDWLMTNENWTIFKIGLAGAVGGIMLFLKKDWAFTAVVIWAAFGIMSRYPNPSFMYGVSSVIVAMLIFLLVFRILQMIRNRAMINKA